MSKSQERRLKIQKPQTAENRLIILNPRGAGKTKAWIETLKLTRPGLLKQLAREMPAEDFMEIVKERVEVDWKEIVILISRHTEYILSGKSLIGNSTDLAKAIAEAQDKIWRVVDRDELNYIHTPSAAKDVGLPDIEG